MMKIIANLPIKSNSSSIEFTQPTSILTSKLTDSFYAKNDLSESSEEGATLSPNATPPVSKYPLRNNAKSTTKSMHNLIKRIKIRQRKKKLENETSEPPIYTLTTNAAENFDNVSSRNSRTHSIEDEIIDKESVKFSTAITNGENSRLNSTNFTNHPTPFLEHLTTKSSNSNFKLNATDTKVGLPNQRTFKFIDLLKTTTKTYTNDTEQDSNDFNPNVKPTISKSDQEQRILDGPSSTKEIKLDQDRIIIWDELKDCIQPFGPSHDQPLNEEIHSLKPTNGDKFDQWEAKEFNKRVLSSPSFNIGTVTVRAEEIGLVLVILLLWAGAISLFINRWGKLRMLEPYQPQYTAPDPTPPQRSTAVPPFININIQSTSSLSLNDNFRHSSPVGTAGIFHEYSPYDNTDHLSPRKSIAGMQSISIGGERSPSLMMTPLSSQRRVRSAVDLVSLVMQEKIHTGNQFAATNV